MFKNVAFIDIADSRTYDLHPYFTGTTLPAELYNSISSFGILTPPTLLEGEDGKLDIISGRIRINCLKKTTSSGTLLCRVFPACTGIQEILNFILEEQFLSTGLTVVEQAMFLSLCERSIHDKEEKQIFLSKLPKDRITRGTHFLRSLSKMQNSLLKDFHSGKLSLKIFSTLSLLSEDDQEFIRQIINTLHLGGNNQKKLIEGVVDLAGKEGISARKLFQQEHLSEILNHPSLSHAQKGDQLVKWFMERNHPRLTKALSHFESEVKELDLPINAKVSPSPSFEKDLVTLTVSFQSLAHLKTHWPQLRTLIAAEKDL